VAAVPIASQTKQKKKHFTVKGFVFVTAAIFSDFSVDNVGTTQQPAFMFLL
jgi:hypothetical protein